MKHMCGAGRLLGAAFFALVTVGGAPYASAQHVTAEMATTVGARMEPEGCQERARQAATTLDVLNANLERARQSNNEAEMRIATDAAQKGLAELKGRLDACRAGAASPTNPAPTAAPAPPAGGAMAGMDHSKMNMAGAAAVPTAVRQISGPAEDALQSFQDALQIGNRDVALHWLAPDVKITESGMTDASRDAYASGHMALDMTFLKTAKVVLLDRQVRPGAESTHIVSTSRITGRVGEVPVDVIVTEGALLEKTPGGWRIMRIEWTPAPDRNER